MYDRNSFLAGLALGRAMWQPPYIDRSNLQQSQPDEQPEETEPEDEDDI